MPYSPIHDDDIAAQLEPLLDAASTPATIVNWGGDDPVSVQEWAAYFGELLGKAANVEVAEIPGASRGAVADHSKRMSLTGPCRVGWREGFRRLAEQFYPDQVLPSGKETRGAV
jgi:nucleoside-diphosphate-sugar epimerase